VPPFFSALYKKGSWGEIEKADNDLSGNFETNYVFKESLNKKRLNHCLSIILSYNSEKDKNFTS